MNVVKRCIKWKKALVFLPFLLFSCNKNKGNEKPLNDLAKRGQLIYFANCIACHNSDPARDGVIGPAIMGASLELIEARIMKASYPKNYKPKRLTKAMVALPHLAKEIKAIHAFLQR